MGALSLILRFAPSVIGFLTSGAGLKMLIGAAIVGGVAYIRHDAREDGRRSAEAACQAGQLRAELAIKQADLDIAARAAADAKARADSLEVEGAMIKEKLDAFEKCKDGSCCGFTGGNADRLRGVVGERPPGR